MTWGDWACIACFTLFYTVLGARFRAAEKALRIPKVLEKAAQDRAERCLENTVYYYFIDGLPGYPGWLP